ncbi:LysR substrate-binding domain-containing protein [Pseudonocardia xinjiangensis]|uniref:LysR substrate-binding domain-containing protein n=1 Tax=Pseudonocardia xinjiangensis TaxID=75289 RepID=UPI003D9460D8
MTLRACEGAGFRPHVRHVVDDFSTVLALVGVGCGVALVPQLAASEPAPGVVLTPVPIKRSTLGACRRGSGTHPAIAAFLQIVTRRRSSEP